MSRTGVLRSYFNFLKIIGQIVVRLLEDINTVVRCTRFFLFFELKEIQIEMTEIDRTEQQGQK